MIIIPPVGCLVFLLSGHVENMSADTRQGGLSAYTAFTSECGVLIGPKPSDETGDHHPERIGV
jgi:hypothetical protein